MLKEAIFLFPQVQVSMIKGNSGSQVSHLVSLQPPSLVSVTSMTSQPSTQMISPKPKSVFLRTPSQDSITRFVEHFYFYGISNFGSQIDT